MADMDASFVRYNKVSESIFIQIIAETLEDNDENRNRVKIIARAFCQKLSDAGGLLKKLKETPEVEKELGESEREELTKFLNGFLDKQINQIVKEEKKGTKFDQIEYSSDRFLLLARFFLVIGDRRMAAECLWGMAAIELKTFARENGIELTTHNSLKQFCGAIGWKKLKSDFDSCSIAHSDGFYEDILSAEEIRDKMVTAKRFVKNLRGGKIYLSPEWKENFQKNFG